MQETNDPLYEDALKICLEKNIISAALIQRYLRVGYVRSAELVDMVRMSGKIKYKKPEDEESIEIE